MNDMMVESPWPEAQKYGSELACCCQVAMHAGRGRSVLSTLAGVVDRGAWLVCPPGGGGVVRGLK